MRRLLPYSLVAILLFSTASFALSEKSDTYSLLNLFEEVFVLIRKDYVEDVKDQDLIEGAINGMLSSLDPHSSYLNEKSFKEMQIQTKGEFGGLGIEVTMENGLVKVVTPIDDTPAFKAGVKAGDYIGAINDEPVMGMTLSDAVEKMRGTPDTKIKITLLRESENDPIDVNITRAIIKVKSVKSHAEKDIMYLRITQFDEKTADLLKEAWEKEKKEIGDVKGIVLDLRNNPGGLLDQAVAVSSAFIDEGEIVSTRGRDPENTKRYMARGENLSKDIPIVVLINSGSASASEIVSGALQDHKRAVIMGVKSFGKASVQTVMPIMGHGAIKLTTARYYTPSGHSIQAKGIIPDVLIEQDKNDSAKKSKLKYLEASLSRHLKNEEDVKNKKTDGGKNTKPPVKLEDIDGCTVQDGDKKVEDLQLSCAIGLLHSPVMNKILN